MATKKVEIMVGTKVTGEIEPGKVGPSSLQKPAEEGVGTRSHFMRLVEGGCGHIFYIYYDTNAYHYYSCPVDGSVWVF